MSTTIRINKDVKELLKLKSVETGVSQIDLANRYILYGIKYDETPIKSVKSIEEIEKLLTYKNLNKKSPRKTYEPNNFKIPEEFSLAKEGEENKPVDTIEEIEKLLKYNNKDGNKSLEKLIGIIETDEVTDSVKLKKESLKPR